jgi:hypothetical protein
MAVFKSSYPASVKIHFIGCASLSVSPKWSVSVFRLKLCIHFLFLPSVVGPTYPASLIHLDLTNLIIFSTRTNYGDRNAVFSTLLLLLHSAGPTFCWVGLLCSQCPLSIWCEILMATEYQDHTVFSDVEPCSLVDGYHRFCFSAPKMEKVDFKRRWYHLPRYAASLSGKPISWPSYLLRSCLMYEEASQSCKAAGF